MKLGRNSSCPCGSGKKYKKCCLDKNKGVSHQEFNDIIKILQNKWEPEPYLHIVPSIVWNNYRWRIIWNTLHYRPLQETFHEFIINILRLTFGGDDWRKEQLTLPPEERHVLIRWDETYLEWRKKNQIEENKANAKEEWSAKPSGDVQALISLAYDLYCLQIVNKLPDYVVKRLLNKNEFQGVRYEIAVAAIIARAGFDIIFLDDKIKSEMHCEFIAKHKETGIEIGVEAKSRRRKGVLHEIGDFNYDDAIKGDIRHLFRKARLQKPKDKPYIIFVDLNIAPTPEIPLNDKPWIFDIKEIISNYGTPSKDNPEPFNILFFTNFSFYYGGDGPSPQAECLVIESSYPETKLSDQSLLLEIEESIKRYLDIPDEV